MTPDAATRDRAKQVADLIYDDLLPHGAGHPTDEHVDALATALAATEGR